MTAHHTAPKAGPTTHSRWNIAPAAQIPHAPQRCDGARRRRTEASGNSGRWYTWDTAPLAGPNGSHQLTRTMAYGWKGEAIGNTDRHSARLTRTHQPTGREQRQSKATDASGDSQGQIRDNPLQVAGTRDRPGALQTLHICARLLRDLGPLIASQPLQRRYINEYRCLCNSVPRVRCRNASMCQQKTRCLPGFSRRRGLAGGAGWHWANPRAAGGWEGVPLSQNWLKTGTSAARRCHVTGLERVGCHVTYKSVVGRDAG